MIIFIAIINSFATLKKILRIVNEKTVFESFINGKRVYVPLQMHKPLFSYNVVIILVRFRQLEKLFYFSITSWTSPLLSVLDMNDISKKSFTSIEHPTEDSGQGAT
jgi:Na+-transporting NADH:ubiquinone oxidoreductase subunit NqrE